MWSKTFTDVYGWRWTFRRQSGPADTPVQLLVSPPEDKRLVLEPFSYGLDRGDLANLARILEEARSEVSQEEYRARLACNPDESAGVREELQRANELAAFAEATASLVCPDCGADTFATRDADGDLAAVCSNNECPRVFVAGPYAELRARLAREAGELQAGRDPRD